MRLNFKKMHGLGNDFVIFDRRGADWSLTEAQIRHISSRHRGVGCDQLIIIDPPGNPKADITMRIYNPDGSEAGACGNATRCVASILFDEGKDKAVIQTLAGLLDCTRQGELVTVNMGKPRLDWQDIPLASPCDTLRLPLIPDGLGAPVAVNMGNPHVVYFVDDVESFPIADIGPQVEHDPMFPERTNVEFAQVLGRETIRMRVWERGAGITEACGSGACATAVAAIRRGLTDRAVELRLDGGNLVIEWDGKDGGVFMTGSSTHVFDGYIGI